MAPTFEKNHQAAAHFFISCLCSLLGGYVCERTGDFGRCCVCVWIIVGVHVLVCMCWRACVGCMYASVDTAACSVDFFFS